MESTISRAPLANSISKVYSRLMFFLLTLINLLPHAYAHDRANTFLVGVEYCEQVLTENGSDRAQALEIAEPALRFPPRTYKTRMEPHLHSNVREAFGLGGLTPQERRLIKLQLANHHVTLWSPDGQQLFRQAYATSDPLHWFRLFSPIDPHEKPVEIASEVGFRFPLEENLGFLSLRNIRGGRFILTLGMDVPCDQAAEYQSGNGSTRVYRDRSSLCRIPVLTVNAR